MDTVKIFDYLLRGNIVIYTNMGTPISELPREPWIGKRCAFQIPAYYYALKAMARKKSLDYIARRCYRGGYGLAN